MPATAFLVDGEFFLASYRKVYGERDANDADFMPAAKPTRHEGIDFILDDFILAPMRQDMAPDRHEPIDGLQSVCPRPS